MVRIAVICFDDVLASSIAAVVDAFQIANQLWSKTQRGTRALFHWDLISRHGKSVTTSSGLTLTTTRNLPKKIDVVFIPALHFESAEQLAAESERIASWCGAWVLEQHRKKSLIMAGCSGTAIVARTGLLKGRTITTSWWLNEYFKQNFPEVNIKAFQLVVEDERISSAGPVNSHFNLAMHLIEKIGGYPLALQCAKTMLVDINRPSQIAYEMLPVQTKHHNEGILLAQQWMLKNIGKSFDMAEAAEAARMSPRTFIRQFKQAVGIAPLEYLQNNRIDLAKRLLESSDLTLDFILTRIGYSDASAFRRLFKERTSLTPAEYRKRFSRS